MDASRVATDALAVAVEDSRGAALRQLLLERERLAMHAEDVRFACGAAWEQAYAARHNDWLSALGVLRVALRQLRRGDVAGARETLEEAEVSAGEEEDEEEEEEEEEEEDSALQ